jgi:hypothetical protein
LPDYITITGVKPYDGRYELDLTEQQAFTQREWGWIKRYAGYVSPLDMGENAFADPEMVGVLALVALYRAGKVETRDVQAVWERFQDAPFGSTVRFEAGPADEEDDGSPPPRSSDARPSSNGDDSTTSSETSEQHPSPTGPPPSATSASVPPMSVT